MLKIYQRQNNSLKNIEDISSLSKYLPLTGGSINGILTIERNANDNCIIFKHPNFELGIDNPVRRYSQIAHSDKNGNQIGSNGIICWEGTKLSNTMYLCNKNGDTDIIEHISIYATADEVYTHAPNPSSRFQCDSRIATTSWCANNFVQSVNTNNTQLYVSELTGSDTEDIHTGRGFSREKPFKTLSATINYINNYLGSTGVLLIIVILDDLHVSGTIGLENLANTLQIVGDNENVSIIKIGGAGEILRVQQNASVRLKNLILNTQSGYGNITAVCGGIYYIDNNVHFISSDSTCVGIDINRGSAVYSLLDSTQKMSFNGTYRYCVQAGLNSTVVLYKNMSGTVTGQRFNLSKNSHMFTNNKGLQFLPGTIEGTMDDNCIYL